MHKYLLAKLMAISGGISTRKRVQKTVFLLQQGGLDFGATFRLHYFGPYSADVASLLDEMKREGVLDEQRQPNMAGWQSEYTLSASATRSLDEFEKTSKGKRLAEQFASHEAQVRKLLETDDLWVLELGSTIAYFREKHGDWEQALEEACRFKGVSVDASKTEQALALAREMVA